MQRPECVSDAQIAEADTIATYDPDTMDGHQLWGQESVAHRRAAGAGPYQLKNVDVELAQNDRQGLLSFIDRVEKIRGALPKEVERLRAQLKSESEG